jgi:hypothetical protein
MIKSRRIKWEGHEARMDRKRNAFRILRMSHKEGLDVGGNTIKEGVWDGMDWMYLAQDRNH